jgi:hypothetical protein
MSKVFYGYSNNRDESRSTYEKICDKIGDIIIDVDFNDKDNSNQLLDKIKRHIDSADIFVCDVTPDYLIQDNKIPLPNPNAMVELGYALSKFEGGNIILLLDKKITKEVPSMLKGFNITYYDSSGENYHTDIVEKINENIKNLTEYNKTEKGWIAFDYKLSDKFTILLQKIINIPFDTYVIRINKTINQAVVLFQHKNKNMIKINVNTKKITAKNKEICVSFYDDLYRELQHLELIICSRK